MKHFLQGKPSLDSHALSPAQPGPDSIAHAACSNKDSKQEPQIEVVKEGDKVTRIVVTCACGEIVEIDCLYPAGQ